jgi:Zn-dependent M16 (insulinase) family peptidase
MGLSYHYSLRCSPETGNLSFCLYKSTQLVQAYSVAKEIVTNYVTGANRFDEVQLESAKSCVIYEIVEKEDTPSSAAFQALYSHFCRVPHNHNRVLLERIRAVSFKDLEHVGEMYFRNLFDPLKISCSICCSPSKVDEIKEELEKLGHSLEVVKDVDDLAIELV